MDKSKEYELIAMELAGDISRAGIALQELHDELFQPLQDEKDEKVPQTTPHEVLKKYIQISREIQGLLFSQISTHVLTIERLADHICCRRAVHAKNNKNTTHKSVVASKDEASQQILKNIEEATKNMSAEQLVEYMTKLMKK